MNHDSTRFKIMFLSNGWSHQQIHGDRFGRRSTTMRQERLRKHWQKMRQMAKNCPRKPGPPSFVQKLALGLTQNAKIRYTFRAPE